MHRLRLVSSLLACGLASAFAAPQALAQLGPPPPVAGGTMSLSWEDCGPLVSNLVPVQGPNTLTAHVTGHALPHQAFQVWLLLGDVSRTLPDAWRFDEDGCNAGFVGFHDSDPIGLSKCPWFISPSVQRLTISKFQLSPPPLGYATTLGNVVFAAAYPNDGAGSPTVNPAIRYKLATFVFDHTFSIPGASPADGSACGGLDQQICIVAIPGKCTWLDLAGNEFSFGGVYSSWATVNGLFSGCIDVIDPVPARPTTWGSIKAQYKR
jgi:hypothetical protein